MKELSEKSAGGEFGQRGVEEFAAVGGRDRGAGDGKGDWGLRVFHRRGAKEQRSQRPGMGRFIFCPHFGERMVGLAV
jgi:hypothetical protein